MARTEWDDLPRGVQYAYTAHKTIEMAERMQLISKTTATGLRTTIAGTTLGAGGLLTKAVYNTIQTAIPQFAELATSAMKLRGTRQSNQEDYDRFARESSALENENRRTTRPRDEETGPTPSARQRTGEPPQSTLSNLQRDQEIIQATNAFQSSMELDNGNDMQLARAGGGSGGNNPVSKETPISIPSTINYGLQETHTTILPWTGWITAGGLDKGPPAQLKVRLNTPYDMLDVSLAADPTDGGRVTAKGFYTKPIDGLGRWNTSTTIDYPQSIGTNATERPAWRDYWSQLYDWYTVIGCEYEIILKNPQQMFTGQVGLLPNFNNAGTAVLTSQGHGQYTGPTPFNTDAVCAVQMDTYSDTATSTGNVLPLTQYAEMRAFKNIKWYPIKGGETTVIKGTYKPGQAKRNIVNDGDVKTWTKTDGSVPNLKEILTLNFFMDPFYNCRVPDTYDTTGTITTTGGFNKACVNMEVNLKYIVQYKDLKVQGRYPNTVITDQPIVQTLNHVPTATGSALQRWG